MSKRYHVTRTINAPPQTVWDLLTDAESYTRWNPAVVSIKGTIQQGETIAVKSTLDPKRTFKLTVTEMDPPRRMVWSDGMPMGLFTGTRTYELADQGGSTEFSMTEEFSGPLSPVVTRFIKDMTQSFADFADGLKREAEGAGD